MPANPYGTINDATNQSTAAGFGANRLRRADVQGCSGGQDSGRRPRPGTDERQEKDKQSKRRSTSHCLTSSLPRALLTACCDLLRGARVSRARQNGDPAASKVDDHIQAAKACPWTCRWRAGRSSRWAASWRTRQTALGHHFAPPLCELLEELCLREHRVPELLDQHALIRRVDIAEPVGRAKEQDLSFGDRGVQRVDERDRAPCRYLHGLGAPRR